MSRLAITGHRWLPHATVDLLTRPLRDAVAGKGPGVTGLSCLADGADRLFARVVLELGGNLEVVVPAGPCDALDAADSRSEYRRLLMCASMVHKMPAGSSKEAHQAASEHMVDLADELWAVWDGEPARGPGGTADVVAYASMRRIPVRIFWPVGVTR